MGWVGWGPSPSCLFILGSSKWAQPPFGFLGYIEIGYIRGGSAARVNLERPIVLEHLWFFSGLGIKLYSSLPSEVAYPEAQGPKGTPFEVWATG